METTSTGAIRAYAEALQRLQDTPASGPVKPTDPSAQGTSFSDMLKDIVDQTVTETSKSELASMQAVAGKGDVLDVVTAVTNAEMTLQTVVNVRDRIIQAYQDIIRMPI